MERESFEDQQTADFLNAHFVSIKVDREERPDVDKIYMTAVQAMAGQGGWPLNCFLTPGFEAVLRRDLFSAGEQIRPGQFRAGAAADRQACGKRGATRCWRRRAIFTRSWRRSPPGSRAICFFPRPCSTTPPRFSSANTIRNSAALAARPNSRAPANRSFLLALRRARDDAEASKMVLHTCERMAAGGIYDQIGGGFARYSVDAQWLVPHFEKMLYDNAQLVNLYLDAFLAGGEPAPRRDRPRHHPLRPARHDRSRRRILFGGGRGQRREGGQVLLLDGGANCPQLLTPAEFNVAARYFGVTDAGKLRRSQRSRSAAGPERLEHRRSAILRRSEQALLASAKEKMFAGAQPARPSAPGRQSAGLLERDDARRAGPGLRRAGR